MTFSVLFVCTGNVCRSPMAERLMRAQLDPQAPVAVTSAGTMALVGRPIDPPSAHALSELGADSSGHVARRLTPELIDAADLVLTATLVHRSAVIEGRPRSYPRVFTIREFGRLGRELEPVSAAPTTASLRERVAAVAARRGSAVLAEPGEDDIGDPFGRGLKLAQACAAQVAEAVSVVIAVMGLGSSRPA
ncbi:MAG: low molecular weight phosphatase family protein [Jatrophihabitans sp.]